MKLSNEGGTGSLLDSKNMTWEKITLKKGTKVTRVSAANIVPSMLAPDPSIERNELKYRTQEQNKEGVLEYKMMKSGENVVKPEPTPERLDELFTKLDLSGTQDWSEDLQQEVHDLMVEYQHLFTPNDLELGRTSKVKHEIKLSNSVPFKDRYR